MLVLGLIGEWIPAFAGMTNIGVVMTFYGTINFSTIIFLLYNTQNITIIIS